jgi:putative PIN family toxin of toxin-antitoxin system
MLTALIDTNVMMVALSPKSNLHWLYQSFINGKFILVVSNDILLEYEEQIRFRYDETVANEFMLILNEAINVIHKEPHYKWNLISADKDDNKFVDVYISAAADYIVTHDKHFEVLKPTQFPVVNIINAFEFEKILSDSETDV